MNVAIAGRPDLLRAGPGPERIEVRRLDAIRDSRALIGREPRIVRADAVVRPVGHRGNMRGVPHRTGLERQRGLTIPERLGPPAPIGAGRADPWVDVVEDVGDAHGGT